MRIVQTANFYSSRSGGLRVVVDVLGRGYADAGHERVLIVPGKADRTVETPFGARIELASPKVPGGAGYRVLVDGDRLKQTILRLRPDRLESSDKLTMAGLGTWARRRGIGSVMFSHERLDVVFKPRLPRRLPVEGLLLQWNRLLGTSYDRIVCASHFAAEEFTKAGVRNVDIVPLGVDHVTFHAPSNPEPRRGRIELVYAGRLSKEKRPDLAIEALRCLLERGADAHLRIIGSGPQSGRLRTAAEGLPVTFEGLVADRREMARLLGSADVALITCPVEAFGLVALEAMACGVAVVTAASGGASELVAPGAGCAVPVSPEGFADGVVTLTGLDPATRSAAARARALEFSWTTTVARMLQIHERLTPTRRPARARARTSTRAADQPPVRFPDATDDPAVSTPLAIEGASGAHLFVAAPGRARRLRAAARPARKRAGQALPTVDVRPAGATTRAPDSASG